MRATPARSRRWRSLDAAAAAVARPLLAARRRRRGAIRQAAAPLAGLRAPLHGACAWTPFQPPLPAPPPQRRRRAAAALGSARSPSHAPHAAAAAGRTSPTMHERFP